MKSLIIKLSRVTKQQNTLLDTPDLSYDLFLCDICQDIGRAVEGELHVINPI